MNVRTHTVESRHFAELGKLSKLVSAYGGGGGGVILLFISIVYQLANQC